MNGFERRTNEKKKHIEETTMPFLKEELNNIKIADIARQAGVSQVSLYNYYGNKVGLVASALKRLMNMRLDEITHLLRSEKTFDQKLRELILWKAKSTTLFNPTTFKHIYEANTEFQLYVGEYASQVGYPLFMELVQQGREEGCIRPNIKDETLILYVRIMQNVFMTTDENLQQATAVAEEFMDMFFYGVLRQEE
ncbi:TetR/AcrR family transcriptional regulator [Priestia taiwanensis]|uniref:TetR family transcriptional regulator n=1 Tax=Priestia taiwanensis TaxID=1347902 RepID=A0A917ARV7_9BACI|nr:TetR/AcrR family transcriptional regulator [Priestia taiwanensis]MBM7363160.1 AcrR family transcriptional regulator [Priestia taiwanensis]GGE68193.1 TetR family transcriptional regulator [Priestia taiwanensis]